MRSNTVFLFSLTCFGEVAQASLLEVLIPPTIPGSVDTLRVFLGGYTALGVIGFIYWLVNKPDYRAIHDRPLGITLMMFQVAVLGVGFLIEGVLWLFLPVIGIVGVVLAGLGIGFFKLAKGIADGDVWALEIMFVLTVVGIIAGIILGLAFSQFYFGVPLISLFQLWYLRRRNVSNFFGLGSTDMSSQRLQELGRDLARFDDVRSG